MTRHKSIVMNMNSPIRSLPNQICIRIGHCDWRGERSITLLKATILIAPFTFFLNKVNPGLYVCFSSASFSCQTWDDGFSPGEASPSILYHTRLCDILFWQQNCSHFGGLLWLSRFLSLFPWDFVLSILALNHKGDDRIVPGQPWSFDLYSSLPFTLKMACWIEQVLLTSPQKLFLLVRLW